MSEYQLAQLNIARMKHAIDAPELAGFAEQLETINALADAAPGFVWRLQTEVGDATSIDFFGTDYLVNMSVWQDVESLRNYAFRSAHKTLLGRRQEWFEPMDEAYSVLWWIPRASVPTLAEAAQRLQSLRRRGPTPEAFSFKQIFEPA